MRIIEDIALLHNICRCKYQSSIHYNITINASQHNFYVFPQLPVRTCKFMRLVAKLAKLFLLVGHTVSEAIRQPKNSANRVDL